MTPTAIQAGELSPLEEKGQQIYFTGESLSGNQIEAFFGPERVAVPGSLAVCSSCHGYDGLGRPESGIVPTNITWSHLAKAYGHIHDGKKHPPFTESSLRRFLRQGTYPGGGPADPDMPIYRMAEADLDALVAYLKKLGTLQDPGVSRSRIRIGTLLPAGGPLAAKAELMEQLIRNVFASVNKNGGLFGRKLELVVYRLQDEREPYSEMKKWMVGEQLFLLLSPFSPGIEVSFQKIVSTVGLPVIAPYTLYPPLDFKENRQTFLLQPGIYHQLFALKSYVQKDKIEPSPELSIIYQASDENNRLVERFKEEWRGTAWQPTLIVPFDAEGGLSDQDLALLTKANINMVVYVGFASDLEKILAHSAKHGWPLTVLASGPLSGGILQAGQPPVGARLLVAFPSLNRDRRPTAVSDLFDYLDSGDVGPEDIRSLVSCYVAAQILVDALQQCGREVDRRKLVAALERTYRFETGLMPPLTFTKNRRIGTDGVYIVQLGSTFQGERSPISVQWFESQ